MTERLMPPLEGVDYARIREDIEQMRASLAILAGDDRSSLAIKSASEDLTGPLGELWLLLRFAENTSPRTFCRQHEDCFYHLCKPEFVNWGTC